MYELYHGNNMEILPTYLLQRLIELFTDPGDVVIDPVAGSEVTLLAAEQLGRKAYGFEIKREYVEGFKKEIAGNIQENYFPTD